MRTFEPVFVDGVEIKRVFCDMDGVLVDWTEGALIEFDQPSRYEIPVEKQRSWDWIDHYLDVDGKELWGRIDQNPHFWENLPKLPYADELVRSLLSNFDQSDIDILTTPSMSDYCYTGKREWLRRNFPDQYLWSYRNFNPLVKKQDLARPGYLLIDDKPSNCEKWREAGGVAILYPAPYNSSTDDWMEELKAKALNPFDK